MIRIENEKLADYLMFKFDKQTNEFSEEELQNIDEIVINAIDINGNYHGVDLEVIKYFIGAKRLVLQNLYLYEKDIYNIAELSNLVDVYMDKCEFQNADSLSNLKIKELELINCDIADYSFLYKMQDLNSLSVVNGNISLKGINKLSKLKYLQLSYSYINDNVSLTLPILEEIHIDNTNIENLLIIENIKGIKRLSISEKQYKNNKEFVQILIENNTIVTNENIVEFSKRGNEDE